MEKGLSPEAVKNLFKRFYEGDYRKFKTIGTGIGLSLTKDLVQLHKGNITVSSKQDEGSAFAVTIPIGRDYYLPEEIDESMPFPSTPGSFRPGLGGSGNRTGKAGRQPPVPAVDRG